MAIDTNVLLAISFLTPLAIAYGLTTEKRSLPFYFVLLLVLGVLFGVPALFAFATVLYYRYSNAKLTS